MTELILGISFFFAVPRQPRRLRTSLDIAMNINFSPLLSGSKPDPAQPSSLDRFVWEKGVKLVSFGPKGALLGFSIAAAINGTLGIIFTTLGATIRGMPEMFVAGGITLTVATIMGSVAHWQYRTQKHSQSEINLNPQAVKMLSHLATHIGWFNPDVLQTRTQRYQSAMWGQLWGGVRTSAQILDREVFEMLDKAAFQYNRLSGLLQLAKDSTGRPSKLEPNIRNAADEAMLGILNQVALVDRRPESASAVQKQVDHQVDQLAELGNRLEAMISDRATAFDRMGSTTALDTVLEDLRLEQSAMDEIRYRPESNSLDETTRLDH